MDMAKVASYGPDPLQTLRVYRYEPTHHLSMILIHGGAWRDPSNSYDDFEQLVGKLPGVNVFGLNYRLSPAVKHPEHLADIVQAIEFLVSEYRILSVGLVGHSVGATMALQLLNSGHILNRETQKGQRNSMRSLSEPLRSPLPIDIEVLVFLDGIYDVQDLVEEYPSYLSFVKEAFACKQDYISASPLSSVMPPFEFELDRCSVLVVQSTEDELLSSRQTKLMVNYLRQHSIDFQEYLAPFGAHEQVYRSDKVALLIADAITQPRY